MRDLRDVRALKTYERVKLKTSIADIPSLLGHSYLHFQVLKAFQKVTIIFIFTFCRKIL